MHPSSLLRLPLVMVVLLAGCAGARLSPEGGSPSSAAAPNRALPKRIVAAVQGEPYTFSTALNPSGSAGSVPGVDAIEDLLHAGLSHFDGRGVLQPQLGAEVPTVENGRWRVFADGRMQTTWRIRDGAAWHDGTPLSADDLLFTTTVGQDKDLPLFGDRGYAAVERVEAADPQTLTIWWKSPYVDADTFFTHLRAMPLPRHLLEQAYLEDKAGFTELPYWLPGFVGTGPYRLQEIVGGSHLVLAANERYVLGRPKIDEIEVKFISDAQTLVTSALAGAAELTLGARFSLDLAVQAGSQWRAGRVEVTPGGWVTLYPQFIDPRPAIIREVRFRRALLHAIDRQELVDNLMLGRTSVIHSIVAPNHPEFEDVQPSVVRYAFDLRLGSQLMEELGYRRAPDGFFQDPGGQRVLLEIRATAQTDIQPKSLTAVADYWQKFGVGGDQVIVPNQRVPDREYRHTRPAFEVLSSGNDPGNFASFHSSRIPLPSNAFTGANRSRYANAELDALIDRYFVTIPRNERMAILGQIVHHMTDQLVAMGLFYNTRHTLIGDRLVNVAGRAPFSTEAWNAHLWDVK